mgnify:CR=1 FL=1|jgi:penicillin-binding protein 2
MFLAPRSDIGEFRKRYKWIALGAVLAFLTILGRLFQLQVLEGADYRQMAHENIIRRVRIATTRGVIRDEKGRILASSRPAYNVYLVPGRVMPTARPPKKGRKRKEEVDTLPRIADALRLNPDERNRLETKIKDVCREDDDRSPCWRAILVREDVARDIVAEIRQHPQEMVGAEVVQSPVRFYPFKNLGAHMMGYVSEIDFEALQKFRPEGYELMTAEERQKYNPLGYDAGDSIGATGIERGWEAHLRGQRGWEKRVVDARGRYRGGPDADRLVDEPHRQDPIAGRDLRLTVDIDLVAAIEKAMRPHLSGAVVVVDVKSGRIRALYSKPDFDPNDLSGTGGRERRRETIRKLAFDPLHPMLDKTMTGAFPPGSTFKAFTAMAALEGKLVDPKDTIHCDGVLYYGKRPFRCTHHHGQVNLKQSIAESCNIYFFKLGEAIGVDRIAQIGNEFGLGQKTGLSINPESPGKMPTRAWYTLRYRGQFRIGFTLNTAIGQGAVLVTPVQLALAYAAIGNGGTVYSPQIVRSLETSDGTVYQDFSPRVRQKAHVSPDTLAKVQAGLHAVVNDELGTAYPVRDPSLDISGKTGTVQTGYVPKPDEDPRVGWYKSQDHAWFASFYPSSAPEVAVVVFIEHGRSGPKAAAPVAIQVVRDYVRLKHEGAHAPTHPARPEPRR